MEGYRDSLNNPENQFLYDESIGTKFYEDRRKGYQLMASIIEVYRIAPYKYYHLRKYVRFDSKNTDQFINKFMNKTLIFN